MKATSTVWKHLCKHYCAPVFFCTEAPTVQEATESSCASADEVPCLNATFVVLNNSFSTLQVGNAVGALRQRLKNARANCSQLPLTAGPCTNVWLSW